MFPSMSIASGSLSLAIGKGFEVDDLIDVVGILFGKTAIGMSLGRCLSQLGFKVCGGLPAGVPLGDTTWGGHGGK